MPLGHQGQSELPWALSLWTAAAFTCHHFPPNDTLVDPSINATHPFRPALSISLPLREPYTRENVFGKEGLESCFGASLRHKICAIVVKILIPLDEHAV